MSGLADIKARAAAARQTVSDLCEGRARWVMRVPAEPDRDPDLVIAASLHDIDRLLAVAEAAAENLRQTCHPDVPCGRPWCDEVRAALDAL